MLAKQLRARFSPDMAQARADAQLSYDNGATQLWLRVTHTEDLLWTCTVERSSMAASGGRPMNPKAIGAQPYVALEGGTVCKLEHVGFDAAAQEVHVVLRVISAA